MNRYTVGTQVELDASFTDMDGNPKNPTTVTADIMQPDGTITELDTQNPALGKFTALFTPTMNGLHQYRFAGEGAVIAAGESYFMAQTDFPS